IKRYRELTGAGLKEAKDAVEAIPREQVAPSGSPIERDLEDEVLSLLGRGQKIEAIRRYRQRTGADLKASKDAVEALAERRGILVSQGTGCLGVVVVSLGLLAGALIFAGTASEACPGGKGEAPSEPHGFPRARTEPRPPRGADGASPSQKTRQHVTSQSAGDLPPHAFECHAHVAGKAGGSATVRGASSGSSAARSA